MNENTELEKTFREARVTKIRLDPRLHQKLVSRAKKQQLTLAAFIRSEVLAYIAVHPLPHLPQPPSEESLHHLKDVRPDALVYTIPISGVKVVASEHPDGGWRGILWRPDQKGQVATWRSENLSPPTWAQTPRIVRTLLFISSRVLDEKNESIFQVPLSNLFISAAWSGERFDGGKIVDAVTRSNQEWFRKGRYATMSLGPYSSRANVRRLLNMLCQVLTVQNNGLEKLGD